MSKKANKNLSLGRPGFLVDLREDHLLELRSPSMNAPIPWAWMTRASRNSGVVLAVGIYLWWGAWERRRGLYQVTWEEIGERLLVHRTTVMRAMGHLEKAGLVATIRPRGQAWLVAILNAGESQGNVDALGKKVTGAKKILRTCLLDGPAPVYDLLEIASIEEIDTPSLFNAWRNLGCVMGKGLNLGDQLAWGFPDQNPKILPERRISLVEAWKAKL